MEKKKINPMKEVMRVLSYVLSHYKFSCLVVLLGIICSSLTTLTMTLFMEVLVDDYIIPLTLSAVKDYVPLAHAIIKLIAVLACGIICAYTYNRVMVNVTQGTLNRLRKDLFNNMESLPIKYFDTHAHGDIMSVYTNDIDTLRQLISQVMPQMVNSCITLIPGCQSFQADTSFHSRKTSAG